METKLGRDVFLALAAIGWSDGTLDPNEADAIVRTALEEGLDLDEISEIEAATKEPVDIGSINLDGMSKADRLFVYAVGCWITRVDGAVDEAEEEALIQLGNALKLPAKPRQHAARIAVEVAKLDNSEEAAFFNLPKLRRTLVARLAEAQKLRAAMKEEAARQDETDAGDSDGSSDED